MSQATAQRSTRTRTDEPGLTVEQGRVCAHGAWTLQHYRSLHAHLHDMPMPEPSVHELDLSGVTQMDTAGADLLQATVQRWAAGGHPVPLTQADERVRSLYERITEAAAPSKAEPQPPEPKWLERIGLRTMDLLDQAIGFLGFVGEIAIGILPLLMNPTRMRWRRVLHNLQEAGVEALPIVGLLSFLMGMVIAYQGSIPLRQYGANIYVVDLVGLSMLREISPIITAIIIAGRTGAAYTAQIGAMKVGEEVDALHVMGVPPMEVLVIPKLVALVIALPLLTVFSDALGLLGGMVVAHTTLDVGPSSFLDELLTAVSTTSFISGIGKTPVFAAIIAAVGCFQGFRTGGSAESVGRQTTLSVVQAIFLVIVVDAAFSIAFSALDI